MGKTPIYSIPYLEPSTRARDIANVSRQQAEQVEAALVNRGATPLGTDIATISARLNRLEATQLQLLPGAQALNGYEMRPGSMAARLGDLVFLVANLWKETGVDNVVCFSVPKEFAPPAAVTFTGIASQGGAATAQTLVLGEHGQIRNWSAGKPNKLLSLNLVWKIGT